VGELRDPVASADARFESAWVEAEPGVRLRLFRWWPRSGDGAEPLLLVAGWVSVVEGWVPLLRELVRERPVAYLETREKRSAVIAGDRMTVGAFGVERLADDVIAAAAATGYDLRRTVVVASSMGANAVLEALKDDRLQAAAAFLIGPNGTFRFPWWGRVAVRMPPAGIRRAIPFALWYLRRFRVNARDDPDQMRRYERTLRAADPARLRLSAIAILDYQVWPRLSTVSTPVAVGYAAGDTLHGPEDVARIVAALPCGTAVECPSNSYMHSAAVADDIRRFVAAAQAIEEPPS
jgi:pimeloyl-ACP methyl ester carboxylesterase